MNNPETLATLDTHETGWRQNKTKQHNTTQKTKKMINKGKQFCFLLDTRRANHIVKAIWTSL